MKISRIVIALALAFGSTLNSTSAALAHDEVVSTSPADGSTASAGVFDVSITFNEDILNIKGSHSEVIQVFSPGSRNLGVGCMNVKGKTMSTRIDADKPGRYLVVWQSASSDGHINTGHFSFDLKNTSNYKSAQLRNCDGTIVMPAGNGRPPKSASSNAILQPGTQGILFAILVAGVLAFFGWRNLKRKKASSEE